MHESALIAPSTLAIRVEFAWNAFLFVPSDQDVQTLAHRIIFVFQFALLQIVIRVFVVHQLTIFSAISHADQLDGLLLRFGFFLA